MRIKKKERRIVFSSQSGAPTETIHPLEKIIQASKGIINKAKLAGFLPQARKEEEQARTKEGLNFKNITAQSNGLFVPAQ